MHDQVSAGLRLILSGLGALFPVRLALGVALGYLVKTIVHVLFVVTQASVWQALDEYSSLWYVIIATPMLFIPVIVRSRGAPESAAHQVSTIDLMIARSRLNESQARIIWRALIEKYLASVQPDLTKPPSLEKLFEETKSDVTSKSE